MMAADNTCEKRIFAEDDCGKWYQTCEEKKQKKKTDETRSYHAQATTFLTHGGPSNIIYFRVSPQIPGQESSLEPSDTLNTAPHVRRFPA